MSHFHKFTLKRDNPQAYCTVILKTPYCGCLYAAVASLLKLPNGKKKNKNS